MEKKTMKKKKATKKLTVMIGIPIDEGHKPEFWISLIHFLAMAPSIMQKGVEIVVKWGCGDSLITRARNNLAHEFLTQTQCEYLCFLDTDLEFTPRDLAKLISHRINGIVCAQYAIKQDELRWCRNDLNGEKPDKNGMLKVCDSGTGAMVIHRSIFKKMMRAMPDHFYTDDLKRDRRFSFFDAGVVKGRYLSEDWLFCRRARALKYNVLVDTTLIFWHHGQKRYPINR